MFIQQEKQEHNQYQKLTKESINIKLMKKQTSKSNTVDKNNSMKFRRRARFINERKISKEKNIVPKAAKVSSTSLDISKPNPKFSKVEMNSIPNAYREKIRKQREEEKKNEEVRLQIEKATENQNYDKPFEMEYDL